MPNYPSDEQFKAVEVFKLLIADDQDRDNFAKSKDKKGKKDAFDKKRDKLVEEGHDEFRGVNFDEIGDPASDVLAQLSEQELRLLSKIDEAFVDAGLFVERNPVPLMIH